MKENKLDYFKELEPLCQYMKDFILRNQMNSKEKIKLSIFQNYLKAKELYMNYNNDEPLIFDDINNKGEKELFTKKYPSLLNFFNCNSKIYKVFLEQSKLINFDFSYDSIPLWLICLRTFANMNNIKPCFKCCKDISIKLEKDFKEKFLRKLKIKYKDIHWILLISPNKIKFIENNDYEKLYDLFNFLFCELNLLSPSNQNKFYEIIRNILFDIFFNAYEKGVNYFITSKNKLFEISDALSKQFKIYQDEKFKILHNSAISLKNFLNSILNDTYKESLNNLIIKLSKSLIIFEEEYNKEYKKNKIENKYSRIKNICDEYNNIINIYRDEPKSKENVESLLNIFNNDIQELIKDKDAYFLEKNYVKINSKIVKEIECIKKNEFVNKYNNSLKIKRINYFSNINIDNIKQKFMLLIENLKKINNLINSLNSSNINKLNELNEIKKFIEKEKELLKINNNFDKNIVKKNYNKLNINLHNQISSIIFQLNDILKYIQIILDDLNKYQNDKDAHIINYMIKITYIYIPKENIMQSIQENENEYYIIKDKNHIIPYILIQDEKIIGFDEIKYNLGLLSLKDSEIQNIYFASFDRNIKYEILKKKNDVDIIQKNKLFIIKVKIKEKTKVDTEKKRTEGVIRLYYNEIERIIKFQINYQLECLKLYLKCDKYKLKYLGGSTFLLNTQILFKDEIINFTVKDLLSHSENIENNFCFKLTAYEDNTSTMPIKNKIKDGLSLQMKSNSENDYISCLVTVHISQRFCFYIKIKSQIKLFDFDFLISQNINNGFLDKKIYCSYEEQDYFDFTLFIKVSNNRLCNLNLEQEYNNKITNIKKTSFINSREIKIKIQRKLIKTHDSNFKLRAKIDNKIKEIIIIFTSKDKCKNDEYTYIDNEINEINTNIDFFSYSFNEMTAHGIKLDEKLIIKNDKEIKKKNIGFINLNQINIGKIPDLTQIDTKIDISLKGMTEFYSKLSEQAKLLPIYCLNHLNEKSPKTNQKLIIKNIYILEKIFNELILNDSQNVKYLEDNFFYDYIKEFISSFIYMKSVIEIKNEQNSNKIENTKTNEEIIKEINNPFIYRRNAYLVEDIWIQNEKIINKCKNEIINYKSTIINEKYRNNINSENCFNNSNSYENDEFLINLINPNINENEMKEKGRLFPLENQSQIFKVNFKKYDKKDKQKDYITKELIIFSKYYMEKFFELITRININYEKISICFIIDCSLYLNIEIKLLNLLIITSIIKTLYIINIQFAILLSADDNFKIIIKDFDDDIIYEDLIEILYEAMIIKRYRNNILKTMKTSLDLMKNKERNIIFLGFFDCLDESFFYINYWLKNILNDKTNSFMLFLEKSTLYKKENKDIINNIIKSFNENIQMHSLSKIKILDINYNKGNIDLENIFFEIANFLNDISELKNLNEDFKRIKNIYNINPQMKRIEYFVEIMKDDYYKKFDKIYFKNNISKNSEINLPEKIYEKVHIILPKYDKKNFSNNNFFKKLLENSIQDKNLIDYIFYPNKPNERNKYRFRNRYK